MGFLYQLKCFIGFELANSQADVGHAGGYQNLLFLLHGLSGRNVRLGSYGKQHAFRHLSFKKALANFPPVWFPAC